MMMRAQPTFDSGEWRLEAFINVLVQNISFFIFQQLNISRALKRPEAERSEFFFHSKPGCKIYAPLFASATQSRLAVRNDMDEKEKERIQYSNDLPEQTLELMRHCPAPLTQLRRDHTSANLAVENIATSCFPRRHASASLFSPQENNRASKKTKTFGRTNKRQPTRVEMRQSLTTFALQRLVWHQLSCRRGR